MCNKVIDTGFFMSNFIVCDECRNEGLGAIRVERETELSPCVNSFDDATAALTANRKKQITIFTKTAGKDGQGTLVFNDTKIISAGMKHLGVVNALVFSYTSASTGKRRTAYFHLENIAG